MLIMAPFLVSFLSVQTFLNLHICFYIIVSLLLSQISLPFDKLGLAQTRIRFIYLLQRQCHYKIATCILSFLVVIDPGK